MNAQIDSSLERPYIIKTRSLTKRFGTEVAVNGLDMDIPEGSIFALIGPSGCGKTTTVRLLTGVYKPTDGEVNVFGKRPTSFSKKDREKIGYLIQQFVLYPDLTVWENLNFAASFYGVGLFRAKLLNRLLEFVELTEHKHKLSRYLSGGMNRRLSLAATLVHNPKLLFLDEPTAGIDPILRAKFWEYFKKLQNEGRTLVITTQYVGEAEYCDLVGIMHAGELILVDTPEGLRRRAYGGDVVSIVTEEPIDHKYRQALEQLSITKGKVKVIRDNEVEILVDDATTAIPSLMEVCKEEGLNVRKIDKFIAPFDDVFVRIIETQSDNDHAAA
jgi:ABC-2 type transport system ATP-binding protein